ncbi:SDR family NAD(P)-dependent oxidoreductase [Solihabitans fulvus]|uniref:SDR family NAD(P)-dependent oxidoreductase n=1 Tax=Solihabitans fulvus TaxID=1892852 RepID=A0A5B2WUL9_9PSEU|nr:oxidoreductase [Solihabitans fulvus]KAA2253567.1 SDR family NAD(P)-dependent oxidoreductase [Solihabitans fulvus]
MADWTADRIPDQSGRTFVVTGANSGLGYETARQLAGHGGRVIMTARNETKGREAVAKLRADQPDADVELRTLDLADLDSVRAFAADVAEVDVLVNNAGIMMPPRSLTKQGFESQFGTNHLGHFALTGLLLPRVRARVVTVSSGLHRGGSIHFDDLTGERKYSPRVFYSQSKFANVLFALELDRRLRAEGSAVLSVLAHPGYSATNLQSTGPTGLLSLAMKVSNRLIAQDVSMGALNQLYAATDPAAKSGQFIGPDGRGEMRGYPHVVQPDPAATSAETARRLWDVSEKLTGVRYAFDA